MNELTQDMADALARAKAREGKTTPAPWEMWVSMDGEISSIDDATGQEIAGAMKGRYHAHILIENVANAELITDAPALQALALAQAALITQLKADWEAAATDHLDATKALEAARARIAELQREIDRLCRVHKITG